MVWCCCCQEQCIFSSLSGTGIKPSRVEFSVTPPNKPGRDIQTNRYTYRKKGKASWLIQNVFCYLQTQDVNRYYLHIYMWKGSMYMHICASSCVQTHMYMQVQHMHCVRVCACSCTHMHMHTCRGRGQSWWLFSGTIYLFFWDKVSPRLGFSR